jgi:hypothetical protein
MRKTIDNSGQLILNCEFNLAGQQHTVIGAQHDWLETTAYGFQLIAIHSVLYPGNGGTVR